MKTSYLEHQYNLESFFTEQIPRGCYSLTGELNSIFKRNHKFTREMKRSSITQMVENLQNSLRQQAVGTLALCLGCDRYGFGHQENLRIWGNGLEAQDQQQCS